MKEKEKTTLSLTYRLHSRGVSPCEWSCRRGVEASGSPTFLGVPPDLLNRPKTPFTKEVGFARRWESCADTLTHTPTFAPPPTHTFPYTHCTSQTTLPLSRVGPPPSVPSTLRDSVDETSPLLCPFRERIVSGRVFGVVLRRAARCLSEPRGTHHDVC